MLMMISVKFSIVVVIVVGVGGEDNILFIGDDDDEVEDVAVKVKVRVVVVVVVVVMVDLLLCYISTMKTLVFLLSPSTSQLLFVMMMVMMIVAMMLVLMMLTCVCASVHFSSIRSLQAPNTVTFRCLSGRKQHKLAHKDRKTRCCCCYIDWQCNAMHCARDGSRNLQAAAARRLCGCGSHGRRRRWLRQQRQARTLWQASSGEIANGNSRSAKSGLDRIHCIALHSTALQRQLLASERLSARCEQTRSAAIASAHSRKPWP